MNLNRQIIFYGLALSALFLIFLNIKYIKEHPSSIPSMVFHEFGIDLFEPTFTERKQGSKLVAGFYSYQSITEVEDQLLASRLRWKGSGEREAWRQTANERPQLYGYLIEVADYSHLGYSGRLLVSFSNDRLENIWFYPKNVDGYFSAIKNTGLFPFGKNPLDEDYEFYISPHTRVWHYTDGGGKKYIGWADWRLAEEYAAWVFRYS